MPVISPEHFLLMNEIWTYSEFSRQAIASISPKPVYIMPIPIVAQPSQTVSRQGFDLPKDRFIVLCSFDPTSSIARKNPFAVIDAFRKAFGNCQTQDAPLLVIKTYNSNRVINSHYLADLHTAINSVNGLLIDKYIARQTYIDLLWVCDAYISLHRSEGFGLNIGEAMALGKPVIATAYSGNMDFMTDENSLGVQYELRAIHQDDHRYQPEFLDIYSDGHMWAEPSINYAAKCLDAVVNSPDQYVKLGYQASHDIKQYYNPMSIGNRIKQHLSTRII
jgi:glycosyltransferase involved in cell wall biosynthesis